MPSFQPNWGYFPFMGSLTQMIDGIEAVVFILLAAAWFISLGSWGFGTISGNFGVAGFGKSAVPVLILITVLLGAAGFILAWAFNIGLSVH